MREAAGPPGRPRDEQYAEVSNREDDAAMTTSSASVEENLALVQSHQSRVSRPWTAPIAGFESTTRRERREPVSEGSLFEDATEGNERLLLPPLASLFRFWTPQGRQAWHVALAVLHTHAVASIPLKRFLISTNVFAVVLQVLTLLVALIALCMVSRNSTSCFDLSAALPGQGWPVLTLCLAQFYLASLAISSAILFFELVWWCLMFYAGAAAAAAAGGVTTSDGSVSDAGSRSPDSRILLAGLLEIVASLDFWILGFALSCLVKHGLTLSKEDEPINFTFTVRHMLLSAAYLVIFCKYWFRGKADLQAAVDMNDPAVYANDEFDGPTYYWNYHEAP